MYAVNVFVEKIHLHDTKIIMFIVTVAKHVVRMDWHACLLHWLSPNSQLKDPFLTQIQQLLRLRCTTIAISMYIVNRPIPPFGE